MNDKSRHVVDFSQTSGIFVDYKRLLPFTVWSTHHFSFFFAIICTWLVLGGILSHLNNNGGDFGGDFDSSYLAVTVRSQFLFEKRQQTSETGRCGKFCFHVLMPKIQHERNTYSNAGIYCVVLHSEFFNDI